MSNMIKTSIYKKNLDWIFVLQAKKNFVFCNDAIEDDLLIIGFSISTSTTWSKYFVRRG